MRRIVPLVLTSVLAFAACGDDSAEPGSAGVTVPPPAPSTRVDVPAGDGSYDHPDGVDDIVVSIEYVGGFMPVDALFRQLPSLLATGDGRVFTLGPQLAIYPGPLLPNVQVLEIGEAGLQELLRRADEHGLLAERVYESPTDLADAPDTVVTIRVGGETYVHRAYALGLDGVDDGARGELAAFVDEAMAMAVGDSTEFVPDQYRLRAFQVDDLSGYELEPTVVEWPLADIELATASDCVVVDATAVGELFADANQLTFFEQDGVTYQLAVTPVLPGTGC